MKVVYIIIVLALLSWKGYYAWLRGRNAYMKDMVQYRSLWEYLLGNGATTSKARRPVLKRSLRRAFMPLLKQWRLWAIVAVIGVLIWLIF